MTYAKVINGEIVEYNRTLPFSTETTSFGVGAASEDLLVHGYYPVVGNEPEYDRLTHKVANVSYTVAVNEVLKTYIIAELTAEEIRERDVPKVITPRQARLALLQANLLDEVETAITTNREYQIYWEYSLEVKRDDVLLNQMATVLGLTEQQVDELFKIGSKL